MDLLQRFTHFIEQYRLFTPADPLLLTVSGGLDSVVLCQLCAEAGYRFTIAHCNFQLRNEESTRDQQFVEQLAARYQAPLLVKAFDTKGYATEKQLSIQLAARELRYQWFHEVSTGKILTAHHLDDSIETLLMNFFKGTGISGLHGILPQQGRVVRPLLFARKEELAVFAAANKLSWVEDSSNASDKYSRNYLRHQILPVLQQQYPSLTQNLAGNLERFREIELLYQQSIDQYKKRLLEPRGAEVHIPVLKLKQTVPVATVLYELLRPYGFSPAQTTEVVALLDSGSGKYVSSPSHRILRNRQWLIIAPLAAETARHILVEEGDRTVDFVQGRLQVQTLPHTGQTPPATAGIACLDADQVRFPLLLRPWKTGDYFYPLGMTKKKKVARFLIDQKVSRTDKEKVWVLEMDKKIVWVVGHRIDNRFKLRPDSRQVLQVQLTNG
ncbi:MAG: tRNA lysidine(34) synthetase TilS [Candidatus Pseudobacter hemicellulosilyticus]|uniref:tRNA(Ile)-lysidine synthase n=1 Tax=Candidatus Pseudobacter hemicellulosilyticus TaxID=3121375 RepID=A0AAJ6BG17_9BACT|nr:MAG: tRNA lysidine(34) synthetase TilS [Pseudobacter sp.]